MVQVSFQKGQQDQEPDFPQVEAAFIGICGYSAVDLLQDVPEMIKDGIRKRFR